MNKYRLCLLVKIGMWVVVERKKCEFTQMDWNWKAEDRCVQTEVLISATHILADLFFLNDMDIASYEDDNTPNVAAGDTNGVTKSLENMSEYE